MKEKICKGCGTNFKYAKQKQVYCTKKCWWLHYKKSKKVPLKKGRYILENAERRVAVEVDEKTKIEIRDFMFELKRKCYYLDALDSFKLINYYVELWGIWYFEMVTIEEELAFCLNKCIKYVKKEFNL